MSFDALIQKVKQAETALETSERRTASRWKEVKVIWMESWTPARIVIAGVASGFLVGRARPLKLAGSGGVLNLVTALSGLLASSSAHTAADEAGEAADAADNAAAQVAAPLSTSASVDAPFDIGLP